MKIVYLTNAFGHIVRPFCDKLYSIYGKDFTFIATGELSADRKAIGAFAERDYIIHSDDDKETAKKLCADADVLIFGLAPLEYIKDRINENKLTIYYSERPFKGSWLRYCNPITYSHVKKRFILPSKNSNFYVLCASSFASYDFNKIGAFKDKAYKWGYQPTIYEKNVCELISAKPQEGTSLIWVGRLVKLKHADHAIKVVYNLKKRGMQTHLKIIGTGEEENNLKKLAKKLDVANNVEFLGRCDIATTRKLMDEANVFLFTSDAKEGWGATLNESMNSACACVCSHLAGATNFLVQDNFNGFVYKSGDLKELTEKTAILIKDKELREQFGSQAYDTIFNLWNPEKSYERFIALINELKEKGNCDLFTSGPCSKALPLKKDWYKK